MPRKSGEIDPQYRARIQAELLLERGTRRGLIKALILLTGRTPQVFDPKDVRDTGAYNTCTMGYGVAGGYGSALMPRQIFVTAYRPIGQGVPNIAGYGSPQGAYDTPSSLAYITPAQASGVTDADIYAMINRIRPLNRTIWTNIQS